jgi:hypothetical protein
MIRSAGYFPAFNRYFLPAARKNNPQVIHKKTAYPPFFFTPFPEVHNKKNKHQLKTRKRLIICILHLQLDKISTLE